MLRRASVSAFGSTLPLVLALLAACATDASTGPGGGEGGAGGGAATSEDETRAKTKVDETLPEADAQRYAIDLVLDATPGAEAFRAEVKGSFVATADLETLTLDFEGNEVDEVLVGTTKTTSTRDGGVLRVALPARVAKGSRFEVTIRYHGALARADGANPNDFASFGGLMVKARNDEAKRIVYSLDWPSKARRWLPVKDHPRDGAEVAWRITAPASFTVVANGAAGPVTETSSGDKTWTFEAKTPMPTYDLHLAAYEGWQVEALRSAGGRDIATYTYPKDRAAFATVYGDLADAMDYFERTFGAYRWESAAFLEEPIFGGGMEHATVVSMDETLFDRPESGRSTAVHELAHHWSGNLVRVRSWSDFWLSEGFAEYLTYRFFADHDGAEAGARILADYERRGAAGLERRSPGLGLRPEAEDVDVLEIFDGVSYQWGALVLRALEGEIGTEPFTAFLKAWFEKHAFGAVTTADFQKELQAATGKDLGAFFDAWVHGRRGLATPALATRVAPKTGAPGTVVVDVASTASRLDGWTASVVVELESTTGAVTRAVVPLDGARASVEARVDGTLAGFRVDPDRYLAGTFACGESAAACRLGQRCAVTAGSPRCE